MILGNSMQNNLRIGRDPEGGGNEREKSSLPKTIQNPPKRVFFVSNATSVQMTELTVRTPLAR